MNGPASPTLQVPARSIPAGAFPFATTLLTAMFLAVVSGLLASGYAPAYDSLRFEWTAFTSGECWRALTYPLVHISFYHFVLDAVATVMLLAILEKRTGTARTATVLAATIIAGLATPALLQPALLATHGLCGFSGPAHGLMAAWLVIERASATTQTERRIFHAGAILLLLKCLWEWAADSVILASWHLGEIGTPIVTTHLGGCLAGLLVGLALARPANTNTQANHDPSAMTND